MSSGAIITDIGLAKLAAAAGDPNKQVKITHVALGDGNGAAYDPDFSQVSLTNERLRRSINSRAQISAKTWLINVVFPADEIIPMFVREIGFFDEDGDLFAIVGGQDFVARQLGGYDYIIEQPLIFDRSSDGAVIVDAPDWHLFEHVVLQLQTNAIFAREQFQQRVEINRLLA